MILTGGPLALVRTGDEVQIAGLVISGSTPKTVLLRASGPALVNMPVNGDLLPDPTIELYHGPNKISANDDWCSGPDGGAEIAAAGHAQGAFSVVTGSKDSAILTTLQPGAYTLIVRGKGASTGVVLTEVYEVD